MVKPEAALPFEQLGPYQILRPLGQGGMGAVYEARHVVTGEHAALKVLIASLAAEERFRERFELEIESLKQLRHPNIVRLYGWGEDQGHYFYAMELVDGPSLHEVLRRDKRLAWQRVIPLAVQICNALKHAHDRGIIHRDLKPGNLLMADEQTVKLSDFGIAKLYGGTYVTAAGGILGTADYMAPEQAEGKPPTVRTDLYSLGSVLYALLAGHPPFAGGTLPEVLHSVRYREPPRLDYLAPDVPGPLVELVHELLEK